MTTKTERGKIEQYTGWDGKRVVPGPGVVDGDGQLFDRARYYDYSYVVAENVHETKASEKELCALWNDAERAGAKSNEYQKALNALRGPQTDAQKLMAKKAAFVATMKSCGVDIDTAASQWDALIASGKAGA